MVLGNRQLLSVFFIVVVLFGVFFTTGYIVGRSSGPNATVEVAPSRKPESKPLVVESPAPKPESPAAADTAPSARETAPQAAAETAPAPKVEAKAAPAKRVPEAASPEGTFLQLAATTQHEAEVMVDVLKRKSFKAVSMEVPEKPGTYRVLVGPIEDGGINKIRSDLQGAGFPGDKAIRRTF